MVEINIKNKKITQSKFRLRYIQLKNKRWKKTYQANINKKRTIMALLLPDKTAFRKEY